MPNLGPRARVGRARSSKIWTPPQDWGAPGFRGLLAARNPWAWMAAQDAIAPIVDSAQPLAPGWGGSSWSGFPMPPPGHLRSIEGTNAWPMSQSAPGPMFRQPGALPDGRKSIAMELAETSAYWSATWVFNDNAPPFALQPTSIILWFKGTGTVGGWLWSASTQFNPFGIALDATHIYLFHRDNTGAFQSANIPTSVPGDGNWHLLGFNLFGTTTTIGCDVYIDGYYVNTLLITVAGGHFSSYGVQSTGLYIAGSTDAAAGDGVGFSWQDFAVFPGGTSACNPLAPPDYFQLWAARTFGGAVSSLLNGIQAYWKFDDGSGTTTLDSSGYKLTGTLQGATDLPTWGAGKINGGLVFDGTDDYVDVGGSTAFQVSSYTVAAWVKPTAVASFQSVFSTYTAGAHGYCYLALNGSAVISAYHDASPMQQSATGGVVTAGQWSHIAATMSTVGANTSLKVYLNGALVASLTLTAGFDTFTSTDAQIAALAGGNLFTGSIDEVAFWNRALTAAEVAQLYNAGAGRQFPFS